MPRGRRGSRSAEACPLPATEWKVSHPCACRTPDRAPDGELGPEPESREGHPQFVTQELCPSREEWGLGRKFLTYEAGIRSMPMYGRKTSGIWIDPSGC